MAGHRFSRTDRNFGLLAKNPLNCFCLTDIAETSGSSVGVNVIDFVRRNLGVLERNLHCAGGAFAIFGRCGHVAGVRRKPVAGKLAINFRAALLRMFELFHNGNASAFAYDKSVAVTIKRARRSLRVVVAPAERSHCRKSGETQFDDRRLGAAGEKNIGVAKFNHSPRFTDRVIGSRAGGDDASIGAAQTELHGDDAAGHVTDQHRDGKGGDALRSFVHQNAELLLERFQSADPAADNCTKAVAIYFFQIEAAVLDRHLGRGHCQLSETVRPADIFGVFEKVFWLKIPHFAADLAIVVRGVEGLDPADAAFAFDKILPKRLEIVADRRDDTETCYYDATIVVHGDECCRQRVPMPTLCTVWKSLPSVLIDGAMMISVC